MSEPVNLNKARKARLRSGAKARADANAAKFGRSKAERAAEAAQSDRARAHLDRHRVARDDEA